jgi:pSer/pThr/pTyr-binding forkhead associated (FHA) protein
VSFGTLFHISARGEVREFLLSQGRVTIGRAADCDIVIPEPEVSRRHALVSCGDQCTIVDLGSANGTSVDGRPVGKKPVHLADGSTIRMGSSALRFMAPSPAGSLPDSGDIAKDEAALPSAGREVTTGLTALLASGDLGRTVLNAPTATLAGLAGEEAVVTVLLSRPAGPRLTLTEDGLTRGFPLAGIDRATIGWDPACAVRVRDPQAAREHAGIVRRGTGLVLRNLDSRHGILVNGARVDERVLEDGDTVRIGRAVIRFTSGDPGDDQADAPPRGSSRRPVVVVPGFGGSELYKGRTRIWPNVMRLVSCAAGDLPDYWSDLEPGPVARQIVVVPGLVKIEAFGRLLGYLCEVLGYREGRDLLGFGYDWRQDNRESARLLRDAIAAWRRTLPDPASRVVLIAHSMGGLVCRYFIEHMGGADACERIILLGTPNRGSARMFGIAAAGRGLVPLPLAADRIREVIRRFASTYQLLPTYPAIIRTDRRTFRPLEDDAWLPKPLRAHLSAARDFVTALEATAGMTVPTTCVFGYGQSTLKEMEVRMGRGGHVEVVRQVFDDAGDDAVVEASAVLERAEIHPVFQRHGALYADRDVQRRLRFELVERNR